MQLARSMGLIPDKWAMLDIDIYGFFDFASKFLPMFLDFLFKESE